MQPKVASLIFSTFMAFFYIFTIYTESFSNCKYLQVRLYGSL